MVDIVGLRFCVLTFRTLLGARRAAGLWKCDGRISRRILRRRGVRVATAGRRTAGEFLEIVDHVRLIDVAALRRERRSVERRIPRPLAQSAGEAPDASEFLRRQPELAAKGLRESLAAHPDVARDLERHVRHPASRPTVAA